MSIMSDQIQFKSSLNQGLTDNLKGWNPMEGGKNNNNNNNNNSLYFQRVTHLAKES